MRLAILIAAFVLAATAPAAAQTQREMNAGAAAAWKAADATMTVEWRRVLAYMRGRDAQDGSRGGGFGYAAALLTSQRAWLAFRDAQCTIEAGRYSGGTMAPMALSQCLARLTRERTVQLKGLAWTR